MREFLTGSQFLILTKKVLEGKVGNERIVFTKDGMIAVTTNRTPHATRIFNVIFALTLLDGFQAQAIRESETGQGRLDEATLELRGWGMSGWSPRTMLSLQRHIERISFSPFPRTSVPEDRLSNIVKRADKILTHPDRVEELILWLESNTHLQDAEYAPSFVISWIIVERNLSKSWESFLNERNVSGDREHKLVNPSLWPTDSVIETLNLAGGLIESEYRALMELKGKRNGFVHRGRRITKDDAVACFELATKIVEHDLEGLLE